MTANAVCPAPAITLDLTLRVVLSKSAIPIERYNIISITSFSIAGSVRTIDSPSSAVYSVESSLDPFRNTSANPMVYVAANVDCPTPATYLNTSLLVAAPASV